MRNARVQCKDDLALKFVTECLLKVKTLFRPIWYMIRENRAGKWCMDQWKQMPRERESSLYHQSKKLNNLEDENMNKLHLSKKNMMKRF